MSSSSISNKLERSDQSLDNSDEYIPSDTTYTKRSNYKRSNPSGERSSDSKAEVDYKKSHHASCHRCGNIRRKYIYCEHCPQVFCMKCMDKMIEEHGSDCFKGGCPVCKRLCCCSEKSMTCTRKYHCYKKCLTTKKGIKKSGLYQHAKAMASLPSPSTKPSPESVRPTPTRTSTTPPPTSNPLTTPLPSVAMPARAPNPGPQQFSFLPLYSNIPANMPTNMPTNMPANMPILSSSMNSTQSTSINRSLPTPLNPTLSNPIPSNLTPPMNAHLTPSPTPTMNPTLSSSSHPIPFTTQTSSTSLRPLSSDKQTPALFPVPSYALTGYGAFPQRITPDISNTPPIQSIQSTSSLSYPFKRVNSSETPFFTSNLTSKESGPGMVWDPSMCQLQRAPDSVQTINNSVYDNTTSLKPTFFPLQRAGSSQTPTLIKRNSLLSPQPLQRSPYSDSIMHDDINVWGSVPSVMHLSEHHPTRTPTPAPPAKRANYEDINTEVCFNCNSPENDGMISIPQPTATATATATSTSLIGVTPMAIATPLARNLSTEIAVADDSSPVLATRVSTEIETEIQLTKSESINLPFKS